MAKGKDIRPNTRGCFPGKGMGTIYIIKDTIIKDTIVIGCRIILNFRDSKTTMTLNTRLGLKRLVTIGGHNRIHQLKWLAQSPDLYTIENLWRIVDTKIRTENFTRK